MKLVDILARELKVWPDGYLSLQQSFAGMVFHGAKDGILPIVRLSVAEDFRTAAVTRAQWQAAVDALKAEARQAESMSLHHQEVGRITRQWNGDGLPPVDLPCQWHSDSQTGWQEVVVLAYSGESAWIQPKGKPSIIVGNPANFRPMRTPKQIAADERLHDIRNACTAINRKIEPFNSSIDCSMAIRMTIEAMIDAGYRKFEIVDN